MRAGIFLRIVLPCAAILLTPAVPAQDMGMGMDAETDRPVGVERIKRKRPGWFSRPKQASPEEQLAHATRLRAEGDTREAEKQFKALVHRWHDSAEAPVAQLAYAQLLLERGKYDQAFREFQYLIENYAGHFPYERAMSDQFRIAHETMTRRRRFLGLGGFESPERALPFFETLVANAPNWEKTAQAHFFIGTIHKEKKHYEQAIQAYEKVYRAFPESPMAPHAAFQRAVCLCEVADDNPRDESRLRKALSALAAYTRDHPGSINTEEAQERLDRYKSRLTSMHYDRAVFYDKMRTRPQAALLAYQDFVKRFPWSDNTSAAFRRIEELKVAVEELAQEVFERVEAIDCEGRNPQSALRGYEEFVRRFPRTSKTAEATERVRALKAELEASEE